jgi:PadR family transcriptional regulator PadR
VASKTETMDMLQGTLDMLILKALSLEAMHGWGITERVREWSGAALTVNQGSLYPSLYRLKRRGWISSAWQTTENNRRARYYTPTAAGRRQLAEEHRQWQRMTEAIALVMNLTAVPTS